MFSYRLMPYLLVKDRQVFEVGSPFLDMTGYAREEVIYRYLEQLLEELFKKSIKLSRIFRNCEQELFLFTKSLEVKQVRVTNHQGLADDEFLMIFYEVPGSRLEYKFPLLKDLLSSNEMGIAIYSIPELMLLKANQQYMDYLEEPYNEAQNCIGKKVNDIIPGWEESHKKRVWGKLVTASETIVFKETPYKGFKRGVTYWDGTVTPLYEAGKAKYIVVNISDVTDRVNNRKTMKRQIKELVRQKEDIEKRLEMKDEFFYYISHEFKTPITVINAAIQAIEVLCKDEISSKVKGFISQIKQNSLRQLRLVNNLLDITRAEGGYIKLHKKNMDIVAVTKTLIESVSIYAKEKGEELLFESTLQKKVIALDDEKYERILLNLLSNAIKFSPKGKTITVRISMKKNKVCLQVIDKGVGIPKEMQGMIFERFGQVESELTKNREGTGIGLCLVQLLVDALGGEISVSSDEGKGSTFTVILPDNKIAEDKVAENHGKYLSGAKDDSFVKAVALEFSDIYLPAEDI